VNFSNRPISGMRSAIAQFSLCALFSYTLKGVTCLQDQ
jgi:hypothetical protein